MVGVLTNNDNKCARNYCKVLKFRLKEEGNETVANCNQLKLKTARDELEQKIGKTVISSNNNLNYKYIEDNKKRNYLFK